MDKFYFSDSKVNQKFQIGKIIVPIDFHYQFLPCGNYGIGQQ